MGVLLNYVPYVLSCPTYLVTHVLLCPTGLVPYAPSCSTFSNVPHASCPTCSRRLSSSCPTCSCASLASRATCSRVLGALCPKCSRASRASGLMCFLSYVPRSKRPLVSHVCYVLLYLTSCALRVLELSYLELYMLFCSSSSLTSGVSSLTFSYPSHVL